MPEMTPRRLELRRAIDDFLEKLITSSSVFVPEPSFDGSTIRFDLWEWDATTVPGYYQLSAEGRQQIVVERFKALARAIGGRWEKNDPKNSGYDDTYYEFKSALPHIGGQVFIKISMQRDMICERVQVSTERKVIPAVEAQPEKVIEEPVFERECKPLFVKTEGELDRLQKELESTDEIIEGELV
jgi:hypothetical protein